MGVMWKPFLHCRVIFAHLPPTTKPSGRFTPQKMTMQLSNTLLLHLRLSFTKVFRR